MKINFGEYQPSVVIRMRLTSLQDADSWYLYWLGFSSLDEWVILGLGEICTVVPAIDAAAVQLLP